MADELSNANPNKLTELNKVENEQVAGVTPQTTALASTDENVAPAATDVDDDDVILDAEGNPVTELSMLKQRATMMNITFSNNIGIDALKKRIQEKLEGDENSQVTQQIPTAVINAPASVQAENATANVAVTQEANEDAPVVTKTRKVNNLRQHLIAEATKLIRVRISNLDPKKKDLPGEILTVANEYVGTIKKYVPYGEATDNGYHIPYALYKMLKNRKFLNITSDKKNGRETQSTRYVREFSIEILPNLTEAEIAKLAASQSAAGGLGD